MTIHYRHFDSRAGFTLLEVLIVASISMLITVSLVTNLIKTRVSISETAQLLISDIRTAQADALASRQFLSGGVYSYRCGYGFSHTNNDTAGYFLYAGDVNSGGNCPGSRQFSNGTDTPLYLSRILNSNIETVESNQYKDIYFESPNGKIYINNQHQPTNRNQNKSEILIRKKGATCPSPDCIYVCAYSFGRIEARATVCPDSP